MKKGVLVLLLLCLVGSGFAQTKSKAKTGGKKTAAKPPAKKPASTNTSNTAVTAVKQIALIDTNKKVAAAPVLDIPLDGYYKKTNTESAQPVAYASLRQADVVFSKRVWREIDLREKMNQYLMAPQSRLIDVLIDAIKNDELRAFDPSPTKASPGGDDFKTPLTSKEAMRKLADSVLVDSIDKKTGEKVSARMVMGEFNPDSVLRFRLKEDWIFDKQRSVYEPRIIGIAPLIQLRVAGQNLDYQPAFWIYFPEARPILAAKEVLRKGNDAENLSFDQVFLKRLFSSYIVKQSNEKDERIKDYKNGIDRLYEADRIKKEMLDWELNLWQY